MQVQSQRSECGPEGVPVAVPVVLVVVATPAGAAGDRSCRSVYDAINTKADSSQQLRTSP